MFTRFSSYKFVMACLTLLVFLLAACAPATPQAQPTQPAAQPTPPPAQETPRPAAVFPGLKAEDILLQLDYEPGFSLPEYRFAFGRTPYFTLLADGRVIYVDEAQDYRVMEAQLSQEEAAALLKQVVEMGFPMLESHTDMCGKLPDGSEPCIADASTTIMRARMEDGSLREIRNYANFSNGPTTYDAIYNLMNNFASESAKVYAPHAATLFLRVAPPPEGASPADWPLDPALVERAKTAGDMGTAVALTAEEAARWQEAVGVNSGPVTFELEGETVSGFFVPWLPGQDFSADIAAEYPNP